MEITHYTNYFHTYGQLRYVKASDNNNNNQIQTSRLNDTDDIKTMKTNRKYIIHEGTNQPVLKIYDSEENKLIKEIPSEKTLDIKVKILQHIGRIFDKRI